MLAIRFHVLFQEVKALAAVSQNVLSQDLRGFLAEGLASVTLQADAATKPSNRAGYPVNDR
eukprot:2019393-Amphidinium_carterae.1